jgi:hypothetical protein
VLDISKLSDNYLGGNAMKPGNTEAINVLISASETNDVLGTIVRMHLLIEELITRYLEVRVTGELKELVKQPRE